MITTKAGHEIVILSGDSKSLHGNKPFNVMYTKDVFPRDQFGQAIFPEKMSRHWNKPFNLRKTEMIYGSEEEIINSLNEGKV